MIPQCATVLKLYRKSIPKPVYVVMLTDTVQRVLAIDQFSVGKREYQITQVSIHKLLRLFVDNHLTWETHVAHLCCKMISRVYVLTKLNFALSHEARLVL